MKVNGISNTILVLLDSAARTTTPLSLVPLVLMVNELNKNESLLQSCCHKSALLLKNYSPLLNTTIYRIRSQGINRHVVGYSNM